jgi:hemolysin activation/secretion protein
VTVETWHVYAAQGLDTLGAPTVGPWQAYATTAFNSSFIAGDSLGVNLSTVPNDIRELGYGRVSYDAPVASNGARLGATAGYSEIWPGDARRALDTRTQTGIYEIKGSIVPLETRRSSLVLTATGGLIEDTERNSLGLIYRDHIRTAAVAADLKLQDDLGGWNYATLILRQGINAFGATQKDDPWSSRAGASGSFTVVDFAFTRYQTLTDMWSLKFSTSGQLAASPLLTSQQFYLGGAAYGPGYYSGDEGIAGSLELRFDQTLSYRYLKGFQLYGFLDRGGVWNFGDSANVLSLSSVGVGVRFYLVDQLQAGIAVAAPVHYHTTANDVHGPRILFSLSNALKLCPDRSQAHCL